MSPVKLPSREMRHRRPFGFEPHLPSPALTTGPVVDRTPLLDQLVDGLL
jgi:hypothetical protein